MLIDTERKAAPREQAGSSDEGPAVLPAVGSDALSLLAGLSAFWMLFATFVAGFYRDDHVGGTAPVLKAIARALIEGHSPTRTYAFGGGGGAYISPFTSGMLDPFTLLPALLLYAHPEVLMNVVMSLHLALFGSGAFVMTRYIGAPRWAALLGALSLGSSGYFVIWGGNWNGILCPYAFLPWLVAGLIGILRANDRRALVVSEVVAGAALILLFVSGLMFAAYYGGIVCLAVLWAEQSQLRRPLRVLVRRLLPLGALFIAIVTPILVDQWSLYSFIGERKNSSEEWVLFAVPLQGYAGLWFPSSYAFWRGPFYPGGSPFTNVIMMCGLVPVWYLTIMLARAPRLFTRRDALILVGCLALLVVIMSPEALGLTGVFASVPVLNAFRWPFRAIPAFHLALVSLFAVIVVRHAWQPSAAAKRLLFIACVGGVLTSYARELEKFANPGPSLSWYGGAPFLRDPETWSASSLSTLRRAGYIANVCANEAILHAKPRLFFYGTMAAEYDVRTVHLYAVPPFRAYEPLGATIKGCLRNWQGVRWLIERGPQAMPNHEMVWDDPRGPSSFEEIVTKTYVGAVVVDLSIDPAAAYFRRSPDWTLLEEHEGAALFVRRSLSPGA